MFVPQSLKIKIKFCFSAFDPSKFDYGNISNHNRKKRKEAQSFLELLHDANVQDLMRFMAISTSAPLVWFKPLHHMFELCYRDLLFKMCLSPVTMHLPMHGNWWMVRVGEKSELWQINWTDSV